MTAQGPLGKIVLFGSGELSASGRAIHDRLMATLPRPVTIAILETPAGFQPNSESVAREVAQFFETRLQNYHPQVHIIPARKKGTPLSPDDPVLLAPLLQADYIFLGPGSPTYAVRNLQDSLALRYILGRYQMGAVLCLASAATLAVGAKVLPVYEIFKAGADLHWVDGLDIFRPFGLELAIVPHWNNREGGASLDTSRCFMGKERFEQLSRLLPPSTVILGIEEHTALVLDLQQGEGLVLGKGAISISTRGSVNVYSRGHTFSLKELGPYRSPPALPFWPLPAEVPGSYREAPDLPPIVAHLISLREEARRSRDWARADALRQQIADMGFEIQDTRDGPRWRYKGLQTRH